MPIGTSNLTICSLKFRCGAGSFLAVSARIAVAEKFALEMQLR
jgi:hypothetical protein